MVVLWIGKIALIGVRSSKCRRMDGLCHAASKWLDDDEHWTWYVYPEGDVDDSKPCNCPLIELPPHGRLIDADALIKLLDNCIFPSDMVTTQAVSMARNWLIDAPTIIESEGEDG